MVDLKGQIKGNKDSVIFSEELNLQFTSGRYKVPELKYFPSIWKASQGHRVEGESLSIIHG